MYKVIIDSNIETSDLMRREALDWLCLQNVVEAHYFIKQSKSYQDVIQTLKILPIPIANEISNHIATLQPQLSHSTFKRSVPQDEETQDNQVKRQRK